MFKRRAQRLFRRGFEGHSKVYDNCDGVHDNLRVPFIEGDCRLSFDAAPYSPFVVDSQRIDKSVFGFFWTTPAPTGRLRRGPLP